MESAPRSTRVSNPVVPVVAAELIQVRRTGLSGLNLAFSPDGKVLAVAGNASSRALRVQRWRLPSLEPVQTFSLAQPADHVAFAPDLSRIVTSFDEIPSHHLRLQVCDGATGQVLGEQLRDPLETTYTMALSYSPQGDKIAACEGFPAGYNGRLTLWSVKQRLQQVPGEDNFDWDVPIRCLAFSPTGSEVAFGTEDGILALCSSSSYKTLWARMERAKGALNTRAMAVTFSQDGKLVAAGCSDGVVWLLDARTGQSVHLLRAQAKAVSSVAFMPGTPVLASGDTQGAIHFWSARTGKPCGTTNTAYGSVLSMSFAPDGSILAAAHEDGTVAMWRIR